MPKKQPQTAVLLDPTKQIAERIRARRKALELTQEGLAQRAGIGRSAVIHYEQGNAVPGSLELSKLARALGLSPNFILSGSEEFFPSATPDHALAQGDMNLMAPMVALCMMVLGRETAERVSALLVSLVKQKLSKSEFKEFNSAIQAIGASLPEIEKDMQGMADKIAPKVQRRMRG